jgi:hypothetical protein
MPPKSRPGDLVTRFRRLVRRLQTIEDELVARGESLVGLALQSPSATLDPRTVSLLRRMDVIDAELVAIEALLPDDFVESFEDAADDGLSDNLNVGDSPFDFRAN